MWRTRGLTRLRSGGLVGALARAADAVATALPMVSARSRGTTGGRVQTGMAARTWTEDRWFSRE